MGWIEPFLRYPEFRWAMVVLGVASFALFVFVVWKRGALIKFWDKGPSISIPAGAAAATEASEPFNAIRRWKWRTVAAALALASFSSLMTFFVAINMHASDHARAQTWQDRAEEVLALLRSPTPNSDAQLRQTLSQLVPQLFMLGIEDPCPLTKSLLDEQYEYSAIALTRELSLGGVFERPNLFWRPDPSNTERANAQLARCPAARDQGRTVDEFATQVSNETVQQQLLNWRTFNVRIQDTLSRQGAIAPFIAIDNEGGSVSGFAREGLIEELPSSMGLTTSGEASNACLAGFIAGRAVLRLGANVNFAPVLDVQSESRQQLLGDRSFSTRADDVVTMAGAEFDGITLSGAIPALKHFPGHGRTNEGLHTPGLPRAEGINGQEFERQILPYRATAFAHAPIIMSAFYNPGSFLQDARGDMAFSSRVMTQLLRGDSASRVLIGNRNIQSVGFKGILISDDIVVPGFAFPTGNQRIPRQDYVAQTFDNVRRLFESGHDMFLIANVSCVTEQCAPDRYASTYNRALTRTELLDVLARLRRYLFENTGDNALDDARVTRLREALVRVIETKLRSLPRPLPASNVAVGGAALEQAWSDTIAFRLVEREPVQADGSLLLIHFEDTPVANITEPSESLPTSDLGFSNAIETPQSEIDQPWTHIADSIQKVLLEERVAANVVPHALHTCSRSPLRAPSTDAVETPDATDGLSASLDRCRENAMSGFWSTGPQTPRDFQAIIIVAQSSSQWNDAIAFATLYERHLQVHGVDPNDIRHAMSRIWLIAAGRPNMLAATPTTFQRSFDSTVRERVNVVVPFTGYREHARRLAEWLTRALTQNTGTDDEHSPPLTASELFNPATVSPTSCAAELAAVGLLPSANRQRTH